MTQLTLYTTPSGATVYKTRIPLDVRGHATERNDPGTSYRVAEMNGVFEKCSTLLPENITVHNLIAPENIVDPELALGGTDQQHHALSCVAPSRQRLTKDGDRGGRGDKPYLHTAGFISTVE